MATADLIAQLKQDFDDVYAAGKAAGGGSGDYEQGYEDGKNSVVDFARYIIHRPQFTTLNMFGTSKAVLNLDSIRDGCDLLNMFNINKKENANITVEHLTVNCPALINNMQQTQSNVTNRGQLEKLNEIKDLYTLFLAVKSNSLILISLLIKLLNLTLIYSKLTSLNSPLCTTIGYAAFNNCQNLTLVNFPVCSYIDTSAFRWCYNLTSVNFPVCITIASNTFEACSASVIIISSPGFKNFIP